MAWQTQLPGGSNITLPVGRLQPLVGRLSRLLRARGVLPLIAASVWEVQSYLSTMALYALLVVSSIWVVFPVMLAWSAFATFVFFHGRKRGMPDLFVSQPIRDERRLGIISNLSLYVGRIWLVGIQAFVFSRTLCHVLNKPARCHKSRAVRIAVMALGLTLFGVTAAHHILSRAGYEGRKLLAFGLIGSVANVTYKVLVSAALVGAVTHALDSLPMEDLARF